MVRLSVYLRSGFYFIYEKLDMVTGQTPLKKSSKPRVAGVVMRRKFEDVHFTKGIYDNPVVPCRDGDVSRAIRTLKKRVGKLGTMRILGMRKSCPSVQERRRHKHQRTLEKLRKKKRRV